MTWVHETEDTTEGVPCCFECWWSEYEVCTAPTPDPASPCGFQRGGRVCGTGANNLDHDAAPQPWGTHRYQPTRCTCGHPIKAVADGG